MIAYVAQLGIRAPRDAAAVLQPAMLPTSAGAAILLYLAGTHWAEGPRRHASTVRVASDISFGVYLAHPIILTVLLEHGLGSLPSPLATLLGFFVPLAGAAALTLAARRTPLSLLLAGRRQQAGPAAAPTAVPAEPHMSFHRQGWAHDPPGSVGSQDRREVARR